MVEQTREGVNRFAGDWTDQRPRATYFLPAVTKTVLCFAKSVTLTFPRATFVSVDEHPSSTSHLVPTTVAALRLPFVWKRPLPSPQRRRFLTFFLAIDAVPLALQPVSFSTRLRTVTGVLDFVWPSLKMPP